MWESAGIVRTDGWLAAAAAELDEMRSEWRRTGWGGAELRNLLDVAMLIVASARLRPESRGLHFNVDHPGRDNERLLRDTLVAAPPAPGA
jgi:L-aspartate oxidase